MDDKARPDRTHVWRGAEPLLNSLTAIAHSPMSSSNESAARVAFVTGSGSGIGAAIARQLALDGMTIVVADRNIDGAAETVRRIVADGGYALAVALDVGDPASVDSAFQHLDDQLGCCDVLVNNAGIGRVDSFLDLELSDWERVMQVNLTGAFLCAQQAARRMRDHGGGRIVNIASIGGLCASLGQSAYGVSKAAMVALTRQLAVELAPFGITVNAVAPGRVDTQLTRANGAGVTREAYLRRTPLRRYAAPEDIASAVSFLAAKHSAYVTGQVLAVDGGFLLGGLLER